MRALIVITFAGLALITAGCSGSNDASPTTEPAATDAPTTTSGPTTTTSTSTTSTTSTSPAPTTTVDPTAQLIADIEADLNAGEQALLAAGADPSNPELRAELERYYSGTSLAAIQANLDGFVSDGLLVRESADTASAVVVQSIEESDTQPSAAVVIICRVDAAVVYSPVGASEAIVDDAIYNTTSRSRVFLVDGVWRLDGGTSVEERPGVATCD